jgi:hypothetical protein
VDTTFITALVGVLTGVGGWLTALSTLKKINAESLKMAAETRKIDADADLINLTTLKSTVDFQELQIQHLRQKEVECIARIQELEKRLNSIRSYIKLNYYIDIDEIGGTPI